MDVAGGLGKYGVSARKNQQLSMDLDGGNLMVENRENKVWKNQNISEKHQKL